MNNLSNVSVVQLKQALKIKSQIETLQSQLSDILEGAKSSSLKSKNKIRRRKMSPTIRAKMAAAAKARWAKVKAAGRRSF